jgi:WD40 repeat protein
MHELLNYYLPGSGQEDLCGFDWYYLWRLCHNESLTLQHSDTIDSDFGKALREVDLIAFSPDGKMLASSGDGKLKLWDLTTGKVLLAKRDSSEFDRTNASYIAFSPEGKKLIAIYRKHPDLKFENEQYAGRVNDIFNISVTQLDLAIGQEIVIHKYSQTSKSVPPSAFSLDRNWLALGSDNGAIKLVDVTTGQEMMTIRTGMKKIGSVVFSPNGHWIAAIGDDYSKVMMWDIINSRERLTLSNKLKNGDTIKSIGFSQDSKRFASASYKGEVRLWGITNAQLFHGSKNKHLPALVVEQMMVNGLSRLSTVFSPDLKKIAFADSNNTVKLIDIITGQIQHTFKGHWNNISSIAFSRDGRRLASGSSDSTVKLWDLNESKDILDYKMYSFDSLAFSSDGDGLGLGSIDGTIKMFEILTGRELFTVMALPRKFFKVIDPFVFPTNWRELDSKDEGGRKLNVSGEERLVSLKGYTGDIHFIKVSPDGKTLVSVSNDNILRLWDINNGQELLTLKGHLNNISSVSFSPDGKRLASGSRDKTVKLWDLNTGQELLTLKGYMSVQYGISLNSRWFPDPSNSIAFSPNGSKLASGSDGHMVKLWDLNTGQELQSLKGHLGVVTSVAFSPDGERLATGSKDKTVKLWDLNTGRESLTLKGHSEEVTSVAFSPDGQKLASGSGQKTVKFWDINNNKELLTLEDADKGVGYNWLRSSIAFLPDGNRMAMGGADGTLKLWDLKNQQGLPTFEKSHTSITSVALSRNGDKLVTGGENGYLTLWDLNNGQKLDEFEGHASPVTAVAFSPDGKSFASVSDDKTIKLWDIFFSLGLERLTLKGHLKGIHSVAFSPDGKRLATGSRDNTVKLWDINTGQELLTLKGHSQELLMGLSDEVIAVAFSPDGRTLASVNRGRIVKLWRSATEQEVLARTKQ